jgi:hypothetical protein
MWHTVHKRSIPVLRGQMAIYLNRVSTSSGPGFSRVEKGDLGGAGGVDCRVSTVRPPPSVCHSMKGYG